MHLGLLLNLGVCVLRLVITLQYTISYTASIDVPLKWMQNVFLCTVNFSILSLKYEGPKMSEK